MKRFVLLLALVAAKDQFILANVVRALGQPFTIVPITGLALATLARKDAGEGSALLAGHLPNSGDGGTE